MCCGRYAHSNTTVTIININILDACGRNLQRKLQEVTSIKDEKNAKQINLSHEIKKKGIRHSYDCSMGRVLFIARALSCITEERRNFRNAKNVRQWRKKSCIVAKRSN